MLTGAKIVPFWGDQFPLGFSLAVISYGSGQLWRREMQKYRAAITVALYSLKETASPFTATE
jgi:hypothetical protein